MTRGEREPRGGAAVDQARVRRRIAVAAACVTFCLLSVGGIVTSRGAGLVFPDWPLSDGSVNPTGWLKNADMMSEHGHRILGTTLGLLLGALLYLTIRHERRRPLRVLSAVAFGVVCVQGLLGGLRVMEKSRELAMFHGILGQGVFCLILSLAVLQGKRSRRQEAPAVHRVALSLLGVLAVQVGMGAYLRHIGGPIQMHLLGAAAVSAGVLVLVGTIFLRHRDRPDLLVPGGVLGGVLLLQLGLGIATATVVMAQQPGGPLSPARIWLPSAHQTCGALLAATTTWIFLASRPRGAETRRLSEGGVARSAARAEALA